MADPDLLRQVASVMNAALSTIPNGTCISDIAADMIDLMLFISEEIAPRSKRPRGPQGWCADPCVKAEINAAWQHRKEARHSLRASPNNDLRQAAKKASKNLEEVRKAAVLSFFWAHVRKLEEHVRKGTQAGLHEHLNTMNMEGKRDRSSQTKMRTITC